MAARGGDVMVTSRSVERLAEAVAAVTDGLAPADGATALGSVEAVVCGAAATGESTATGGHKRRRTKRRGGWARTGRFCWSAAQDREEFFAQRSAVPPLGRPATAEDFGDTAVGILGSRYLTGQVVVLDGGDSLLGG